MTVIEATTGTLDARGATQGQTGDPNAFAAKLRDVHEER